jgi:cytochrome P450
MSRERAVLPPGPRTPAAWQLLRYSLSYHLFLEECARRYGDPFTIRLGGYGKLVILADPEAVRDVFRGDPKVLHSGEGNQFLSATVGANSVLVLDDEPHARQRKVLLPPLKGERMRSFFEAMQAETLEAVRAWPVGQPLRMDEPMRQITLRVMLQTALGLAPGARLQEFERKVHRVLAPGRNQYALILLRLVPFRLLRNASWLPYFRLLRDLDQALYALFDERWREPPAARGDNVLTDLLAAADEDGQPLSNQVIRDALVTLLVAGHETTSVALAWALEQIVSREDVVERLVHELQQITGGGLPRAEQLSQLEYLDAAIRESLRIRTILPLVVRQTKGPFVAAGREYPPGVLLCPCNHLVHRRQDLYPNPETFRPERFLERKYAAHEWFPFGGGNRMCLGMAFALYEMKVVLSTLFSQVHLSRPPGSHSTPVRCGITLAPDDGVMMLVGRKAR